MDEVSALRSWLNERPNDSGSDLLFVSQKGPFDRNTLSRIFAKYCRLASEARVTRGEKPIAASCWHIHALKHSRVTSVIGKMDLYLVNLSVAAHSEGFDGDIFVGGKSECFVRQMNGEIEARQG